MVAAAAVVVMVVVMVVVVVRVRVIIAMCSLYTLHAIRYGTCNSLQQYVAVVDHFTAACSLCCMAGNRHTLGHFQNSPAFAQICPAMICRELLPSHTESSL